MIIKFEIMGNINRLFKENFKNNIKLKYDKYKRKNFGLIK